MKKLIENADKNRENKQETQYNEPDRKNRNIKTEQNERQGEDIGKSLSAVPGSGSE